MQRFGIRRLGALLSLVLVFGVLAAGFSIAQARQSGTPEDGPGTPRPGHIHAGSCANLGDVDYALNNATVDNLEADYSGSEDFVGSTDALPAYASNTTLDVSLDEILSSDHAINFHLSADEIQTYIACGDLGGYVHNGVLYVGLAPDPSYTGDTRFAGTAVLTDNGDNTTDVVVQLVELPAGSTSTAPVGATPVTVPNRSAAGSAASSAAPSASGSAAPSASSSAAASASSSAAPSSSSSAAPSASSSAASSASASAEASANESAAASADESAAASADESAAASADESTGPIESTEPAASPSE